MQDERKGYVKKAIDEKKNDDDGLIPIYAVQAAVSTVLETVGADSKIVESVDAIIYHIGVIVDVYANETVDIG